MSDVHSDKLAPGPLAGIRVLDLTRILPGPMAGMLLGDFGADVIKVEQPGVGDSERGSRPDQDTSDFPPRFAILNRNKRSVTLDLKSPLGRDAFLRLADTADVILEGFRPGVVDRLGIGYDAVRARNPRIVYCSLSGYGQTGPYASWPGHDINYLASSGMGNYMTAPVGRDGTPGTLPWFPLADIAGGTYPALLGILVALAAGQRTGEGDYVDASMHDGATFLLATRLHALLQSGTDPHPASLSVTGALPGYAIYECGDRARLALGCLEPVFWSSLRTVLAEHGWELPETQPTGYEDDARAARRTLAEAFSTDDRDVWLDRLTSRNVPASPVHTLDEVSTDEHVQSRGLLPSTSLNDGLEYHVGHPVHLRGNGASIRSRAPRLGEHTDEVLRAIGLHGEDIAGLTDGTRDA